MRYWVNQDMPTHTTIHHADSPDRRCQPQDKRPQDGRWHTCPSEESLVELARELRQQSPATRWKRCQICLPAVPDELGM